jgi:hypothetical protein
MLKGIVIGALAVYVIGYLMDEEVFYFPVLALVDAGRYLVQTFLFVRTFPFLIKRKINPFSMRVKQLQELSLDDQKKFVSLIPVKYQKICKWKFKIGVDN